MFINNLKLGSLDILKISFCMENASTKYWSKCQFFSYLKVNTEIVRV